MDSSGTTNSTRTYSSTETGNCLSSCNFRIYGADVAQFAAERWICVIGSSFRSLITSDFHTLRLCETDDASVVRNL